MAKPAEVSKSLKPLPVPFWDRDTVNIAKDVIGKVLVSTLGGVWTSGRIVETEAYITGDAACHAFKGETRRNAAMFGPPGTAYVYLIYGFHWCLNLVTCPRGRGEAVLIRALEPLEGLEVMAERRGCGDSWALLSGPGKLCQAMAITAAQNGLSLNTPPLMLLDDGFDSGPLIARPRVGLTKNAEVPWRFYSEISARWVSRK